MSVQKARGRGGARLWGDKGVSRARGEEITLGEEVSFVLPTPHSKDPVDLIRIGRVEEERLPGALGAKSGITGWGGALQHRCAPTQSHQPGPWMRRCPLAHLGTPLAASLGGHLPEGLRGGSPTLPVPSSRGLRSTPSKVTLGRGASVRAARVGSRSKELASSWVTPGGRG